MRNYLQILPKVKKDRRLENVCKLEGQFLASSERTNQRAPACGGCSCGSSSHDGSVSSADRTVRRIEQI